LAGHQRQFCDLAHEPERIEGFGHPRALDGSDIKQLADRHSSPEMRQQQLAKLDLAVRDEALSFGPAETEGRKMHWLVHQEEHHEVDHAGRLLPLLKTRSRLSGSRAASQASVVDFVR
jgi:hypothetical protein